MKPFVNAIEQAELLLPKSRLAAQRHQQVLVLPSDFTRHADLRNKLFEMGVGKGDLGRHLACKEGKG